MIKNEKGFWAITEICLNYINKQTGYTAFRCYPSQEDAEAFTNEITTEEPLSLRIDPERFDEFFSEEILDNKGITEKLQAYKYFQSEGEYFSKLD